MVSTVAEAGRRAPAGWPRRLFPTMRSLIPIVVLAAAVAGGCRPSSELPPSHSAADSIEATPAAASTQLPATPVSSAPAPLPANEEGRIPVLEYHLIGGTDGTWTRSAARFRGDLELLHARGYRPVSVSQLVSGELHLAAGLSPVVFTFDDASPSQFRWIERDGNRVVDDTSAIGIWRAFQKEHADWESRATFCLLPGAMVGRSFFGDKGIEGQKTEWRFEKLRELVAEGFELCDHTLWHATLSRYPSAVVQEQIARGVMAIDSAVPGYRVRTFALPLGIWPKDRSLARRGAWTDPKSGRTVRYDFDAILLVAGGPARSPHDPAFDPLKITRTIVTGNAVEDVLDALDKQGNRYVSDGDPKRVARPTVVADAATATAPKATRAGSARSARSARKTGTAATGR